MSTRAQLSLSFACLFGAIVAGLAFSSYLAQKNDAYQRLDAELQVASGATAMSAEHELNEHATKLKGERDLQSVLDESKSSALRDTEILVCDGSREAAHKLGVEHAIDLCGIQQDSLKDGTYAGKLRIARTSLSVPKFDAVYVVYAARSTKPLQGRLQRLGTALLLLASLGFVAAGAAGYLLASRTLRPLQELTRTVDKVSSSDLSARVHVKSEGGEIGILVRRFNSLLGRLEQAFLLQRTFMADASHQLRTPVTVALAAAQVISRDRKANIQDCRESLQVIENQMLQLRRTIEDMFFLSQADTASLRIKQEEMYLDDAVSDAVRSAMTLADAKEQALTVGALPEAKCLGDEELLAQAILIVLDNAVKYTPSHGAIEAALFEREGHWICSVTDNGPGVSKAAQARIFERFFRENRAGSQTSSGAGLGLPIAKSIVESHRGSIALAVSEPGRTTFEIAIPTLDKGVAPEEVYANALAVKI